MIGSEYHTASKYLRLSVRQLANNLIHVDQIPYTETIKEIKINYERKSVKEIHSQTLKLKIFEGLLVNQVGLKNQTRPNLAFDLCDLSSRVKNATVRDLFQANKVLAKAKAESVTWKYQAFDDLSNMKLVVYNDASFGNIIDGRSQGGFGIYIVDEEESCSPLMWQSRKLRRAVKSAIVAETLSQVDSADATFCLAKLFNNLLYANPGKATISPIESLSDSRQLLEAAYSIRVVKMNI